MNSETEQSVVTVAISLIIFGTDRWFGFETAVLLALVFIIGALLGVWGAVRGDSGGSEDA